MSADPSVAPRWLRSLCLWSCLLVWVCDLEEDRGREVRPGVGWGVTAPSPRSSDGASSPPHPNFISCLSLYLRWLAAGSGDRWACSFCIRGEETHDGQD